MCERNWAPENYQLTSVTMSFQVTREDHGKEIEIPVLQAEIS